MNIFSYQTTISTDFLLLVIFALFLIFDILRVVILTKFQNQYFHVKSIRLGNLARSESNLSISRFHFDKSIQKTIFCRTWGPVMVQKLPAQINQYLPKYYKVQISLLYLCGWFTFIRRLAVCLSISIHCLP